MTNSAADFEDTESQSTSACDNSTSAIVAIVACNVILVLMLSACSVPA